MCNHVYFRLRKGKEELLVKLRNYEDNITALHGELKLRENEIQNNLFHITELKDLLQTTVKEKSKPEKRLGEFG